MAELAIHAKFEKVRAGIESIIESDLFNPDAEDAIWQVMEGLLDGIGCLEAYLEYATQAADAKYCCCVGGATLYNLSDDFCRKCGKEIRT